MLTDIRALLQNAVDHRTIPGAVFMAANRKGDMVCETVAGETLTSASLIRMASCTKLFTIVAVMQCVERGQLSLHGEISTVLPEWKAPSILRGFDEATGKPIFSKGKQRITLRHLVTHTSGMAYEFLNPQLQKWREYQVGINGQEDIEGDLIKKFLTPLVFEPGEAWAYGPGLEWAGAMVERVNGGEKLGDYMRRHMWSRLGITSVTFRPYEHVDSINQLCKMFVKDEKGALIEQEWPTAPSRTSPRDDLGGGGIYCSPAAFMRLLISLLRNDGCLLRPETTREMFQPALPQPEHFRTALEEYDEQTRVLLTSGANCHDWGFSLAGIVAKADIRDFARSGAVSWGGLPNIYWWIDVQAGHCGLYASQLMPPAEPQSLTLATECRKRVHAFCGS